MRSEPRLVIAQLAVGIDARHRPIATIRNDDTVDELGGLVLGEGEVAGGPGRQRRWPPSGGSNKEQRVLGLGLLLAIRARPMAMMAATMPTMRSVLLSLAG
jgi:hypothetical protein